MPSEAQSPPPVGCCITGKAVFTHEVLHACCEGVRLAACHCCAGDVKVKVAHQGCAAVIINHCLNYCQGGGNVIIGDSTGGVLTQTQGDSAIRSTVTAPVGCCITGKAVFTHEVLHACCEGVRLAACHCCAGDVKVKVAHQGCAAIVVYNILYYRQGGGTDNAINYQSGCLFLFLRHRPLLSLLLCNCLLLDMCDYLLLSHFLLPVFTAPASSVVSPQSIVAVCVSSNAGIRKGCRIKADCISFIDRLITPLLQTVWSYIINYYCQSITSNSTVIVCNRQCPLYRFPLVLIYVRRLSGFLLMCLHLRNSIRS